VRSRAARIDIAAAVCAAAAAAAAALLPAAPALAAADAPKITASPALSPGFKASVSDYASRCTPGKALKLAIDAPKGVTVAVQGAKPQSGKFSASVSLRWGEAAALVVKSQSGKRHYRVRCVPPDFPRWKFKRFGTPAAQWYLIAPVATPDGTSPFSHYVTMIDGHGTPVWWKREPDVPFNSTLLPNGELAWGRWYAVPFGMKASGAWEVHRLDGSLVRTLRTKGSPTDMHDMEPLPGGDYLLITYRAHRGVDLRPYGGKADGAVFDAEIQRLSPAGKVVWRWNSKDHIELSENVNWRGAIHSLPDGKEAWDYFHLNAVEPDGKGLVISARHVDAVYRIDRTGDVDWKLGGTTRPESLAVDGDDRPEPFIGMHDVRKLPDGTFTVFDNHTFFATPRAVRFRVDTGSRTATILDRVTEPSLQWSPAEGSARRLPNGHWVVSWGATPLISERTSSNRAVWRLTLKDAQNYRVQPIPFGRLEPSALRRAMDRMYARRSG
jgi:Arylsulfotransferase (ASST)